MFLIWLNPRIFMDFCSKPKFAHLGSRQCIKESGSILDLMSNQELEFFFFLFEGKAMNIVATL